MTLLDIAVSYIGMQELTPRHHAMVEAYNSILPKPRGYTLEDKDSWCAAFITVCADQAGLKRFPRECGCEEMRKKFNTGEYYLVQHGQTNDIIWYTYSHVGVIHHVDNAYYYTIEGNANNQVLLQAHPITASYIKSIGRIGEQFTDPIQTDLTLVARKVIAGKYGNQPERQARLEAEGYEYTAVQALVNQMLMVHL